MEFEVLAPVDNFSLDGSVSAVKYHGTLIGYRLDGKVKADEAEVLKFALNYIGKWGKYGKYELFVFGENLFVDDKDCKAMCVTYAVKSPHRHGCCVSPTLLKYYLDDYCWNGGWHEIREETAPLINVPLPIMSAYEHLDWPELKAHQLTGELYFNGWRDDFAKSMFGKVEKELARAKKLALARQEALFEHLIDVDEASSQPDFLPRKFPELPGAVKYLLSDSSVADLIAQLEQGAAPTH